MRALFLLATLAASAGIPANYEHDLQHARQQRAKELTGPRSWFSLVALQPVTPGDLSVGSAPGNRLRLEHGPAHAFTLHIAGDKITLAAVDPSVALGRTHPNAGDAVPVSDSPEASLQWNGLWANVIHRTGDQLYLRVGDPHSSNLEHFHGLNFYPVDPTYRLTAKWVPYPPGHELRMGTVLGTTLVQTSPGYVEFSLKGQTIRLDATGTDAGLEFAFRDGTYRSTTYGAGRQLAADPPSHGIAQPGAVVLDFNKAINWPCAYTEYGTCPLPPVQNRFAAEIPAGEKRYHD